MKVLITGVAGFVGSRLSGLLLRGGHTVIGFDLLDEEDPPQVFEARLQPMRALPAFTFIRGDVTDRQALLAVVDRARPDALVHLASRRDLLFCEQDPSACLRLHLEGAVAVLEACRQAGVPQAVLASSAHVYGGSRRFPFSEDDPADRPLSILGAAQRGAELCAQALSLRSPLAITVLRLFSVYGPTQSARGLLPRLAAAAERRSAMPLYGDGTAGRDLIFVDDVAAGILRVLERPAPFRILNLGTGQTTTLGQVAEQVAYLSEVELRLDHQAPRAGELPQTFADVRAAQEALQLAPAVRLEEGIRRFLEWHRTRPDAFRN